MKQPFSRLLTAALLLPGIAVSAVNEVRVVQVPEGDVVVVEDDAGSRYPVRLAGVDAPEADQPSGEEARALLERWTLGQPARLEWDKVDRHGRAVGKLWVVSPDMPCLGQPDCPKNLDVGHGLVAVGLAWHFKRYESEQPEEDRARYADDEREARARKAGLWAAPDAVAPWDWREGKRPR